MNDNINDYVPSILNPRCVKKDDFSLTQISIASRPSLSLRRNKLPNENVISKDACHKNTTKSKSKKEKLTLDKENLQNTQNVLPESQTVRHVTYTRALSGKSLGFSAIEDFQTNKEESSAFSFGDIGVEKHEIVKTSCDVNNKDQESLISLSSATDLGDCHSDSTILYNTKPIITVCFGIENCDSVEVTTNKSAIKRFLITHTDTNANVECEVLEGSEISTETEVDENMNETSSRPLKRSAIAVNLEIKKRKLSKVTTESSKILILKTNATEKISHVIVQPPNYKFVKRHLIKSSNKTIDHENGAGLKQIAIDSFFRKTSHATEIGSDKWEDAEEMSKNSGVTDAVKYLSRSTKQFRGDGSPRSAKLPSKRDANSPRPSEVKTSSPVLPPRDRSGSVTSHSPRKNAESILLNPVRTKSIRSSLSPKIIPHHKIVAGTHFAVDAFSYGDIPNVKHYFLTHFHSDHYSGLKKSFNKFLFCSKITADLCISRLSVNPKYIQIINVDETLRIDGVEVTAVDANHCPGALMLVFTLPNGKSLLHTGDFRACPPMESYPVFWNRDIHTVYLDTTYCNPRYDFPTQDQSLEMALHILRQKKMALENADKKFTSVLIVCGTYTIGKEKFFLGMSRRVGCTVWACPEKERVLLTVEGKARSRDSPQSCQLHVVPMRDLTHEKLRSYLDSLQPAFSEVVAFKPSGWENGKTTGVEKDGVTIHGIPYSEHSSFSELIRFVKFLKPKQVVPTVDISGGVKAVQKYFPCPLVYKEEVHAQSRLTDFFSIQQRQTSAVT